MSVHVPEGYPPILTVVDTDARLSCRVFVPEDARGGETRRLTGRDGTD